MKSCLGSLFSCMVILSCLFSTAGTTIAYAETPDAWWDNTWPYRVPVAVTGSGVASVNLDFSHLFSTLGLEEALLDLRSVRVVPYQDNTPGTPIPYTETYSTLFIDTNTINTDSGSSLPYWYPEEDTTFSLDEQRFTQGTGSVHAKINIKSTSISKTGFRYHFNVAEKTDWSNYDVLLYDIWPEVNPSALDQTPDLFFFELGGLNNCSTVEINGPAMMMNTWNGVSVSLKPFGNCVSPGLTALDFLRFFARVNQTWDNNGYFDPGDLVDLWLDNFRLVDQNGTGEIRWNVEDGVDRYYIYFDTLNHEGHPPPNLIDVGAPTTTAITGAPEVGGYFHQIAGASTGSMMVWNAPPSEKVLRTHQAPVVSQPLLIHAARGEFEPIQLVAQSPTTRSLTVMVSDLIHSNGISKISPGQVELFRVDYVELTQLSDFYGRTTFYPDPLYPVSLGQKIEFLAGKNQPLWLRIQIPNTAAAGTYSGIITIGTATIPFSVKVWDFSLPPTPQIDSKFGFDWDSVMEIYKGTINGAPQACHDNLKDAILATFKDYRLTPSVSNDMDPPEDVLLYSLTSYEIIKAQEQQTQAGKHVWWEFSPYDHPPLPNPAVIDRPGVDARILPWLAWLDRVDGLYYPQTADWDGNPWHTPFSNYKSNGNDFFFYPPKDNTIGFNPCNEASNRLVPSIRLELLREGLEDYAYLWLLNNGNPIIGEEKPADTWALQLIDSRTAFNRIPTGLNSVRISIAEIIELNQSKTYLPLIMR